MKQEKRNQDIYNESDNYMHSRHEGRFFLPRKDSHGNDMLETYRQMGIKIIDAIEQECCVELPKGWEIYFDEEHFSRQASFIRSYHSVVCDENDNVVFDVFTKRMGMRMIEFEVVGNL